MLPFSRGLMVSHIFFAGHGGNGNSHGKWASRPKGAQYVSPGPASGASAALGERAFQISPSPPRILCELRSPLPERGRGASTNCPEPDLATLCPAADVGKDQLDKGGLQGGLNDSSNVDLTTLVLSQALRWTI
jgi:hypothetical protein